LLAKKPERRRWQLVRAGDPDVLAWWTRMPGMDAWS